MDITSSAILFFSAIAGGFGAYLFKGKLQGKMRLLLAFGASYLIALCLLHLFPIVYNSELEKPGIYVLAGFILQLVLEYFSDGLEHGHSHSGHDCSHEHQGASFPILLMISLGIHSLIEGMPFGVHEHHDHNHALLTGIVIHKIPVAIVLGTLFLQSKFSLLKAGFWLFVFACMSPLGAVIYTFLINQNIDVINFIPKVTGVLIGILMHVATTVIFESSDGHKFNLSKLIIIFLGIALGWLIL